MKRLLVYGVVMMLLLAVCGTANSEVTHDSFQDLEARVAYIEETMVEFADSGKVVQLYNGLDGRLETLEYQVKELFAILEDLDARLASLEVASADYANAEKVAELVYDLRKSISEITEAIL